MHFPVPAFRQQNPPEPPADVRHMSRSDVLWDRPIFKAPPIRLNPKIIDPRVVAADLLSVARVERAI
jgi:hypothetical protein